MQTIMQTIKQFRSVAIFRYLFNIVSLIIVSVVFAFVQMFCNNKTMAILQQNHYYIFPTLKWVFSFKTKNKNELSFFIILDCVIVCVILALFKIWKLTFIFYYIPIVMCLVYLVLLYNVVSSQKLKKPLVQTFRIKRLNVTFIILFSALGCFVLLLSYILNPIMLILFIALNLLSPVILCCASLINYPYEKVIQMSFIIKAKQKLKTYKHLIVVAITGSYGKTSTKNFLKTMLSKKFSVLCSPNSFNTPMGVTKTILEHLKPHHQILILEMGADHKNDIKKLCKIVSPDVCVVTSVGKQHLKTFKTFENIIKTKYQIVEFSKPNAMFVTNLTNDVCKNYFARSPLKNYGVNFVGSNAFCVANKPECFVEGTAFWGFIDGKKFNIKTKLLGSFNTINIMLAMVVAYNLGVDVEELEDAAITLKPVEHRLELKQVNTNLFIIDDSFNSNPLGAKVAVETLKQFAYRKIIITCGMVELGQSQFSENYNFGKLLCGLDEVIVVNNVNFEAISSGVINAGGVKPKLFNSFSEAYKYATNNITEKTIILIENDLTDSYIM